MRKKTFKLISILLIGLIMVGCAGLGDYEIDLINGYRVVRSSAKDINIYPEESDFDGIQIPSVDSEKEFDEDSMDDDNEYIVQVGHDKNRYIVAKTNLNSYYIIDTKAVVKYGPLTNTEFNKEKDKLNIMSTIELKDLDEYEQDHGLPEKILLIEIFVMLPFLWMLVLPFNFIFNSIILVIILKVMKMNLKEIKNIYKLCSFKICFFTWLSQLIAILIMGIPLFIDEFENLNRRIYFIMKESLAITTNPFDNMYSFIFLLILVGLIGIMNYLFVYKISLKDVYENKYIDEKQIKKIALLLALFNIPYFVYFSIGF